MVIARPNKWNARFVLGLIDLERCEFCPARKQSQEARKPKRERRGRTGDFTTTVRLTQSGGKRAAVQRLCASPASHAIAKRMDCAWPVLIGLETLQRLRVETILDPDQRVKVSREDVRSIIMSSLLRYPFKNSWKKLAGFSSERR